MKVAIIIKKLNVKGGTQRQALSLGRELNKEGHDVIIYTFHYSKENCYPDLLKDLRIKTLEKESYQSAENLAKIMDKDFDILNPHDQVSYHVSYYYKKLWGDIPSVWNMNDLPTKMWGYDRMVNCDETFRQPWYRKIAYKILDTYDNWKFIRVQDEIVVVDFFNRDLVLKYLGRQAFTVRSGPDFELFPYIERKHPKQNIKLLTSGIFLPHRRYEDAITSISILKKLGIEATLTIMGDTENDRKYYQKLKRLSDELGLNPNVNFTGKVSESDLLKNYHDADIYLFQHHLQSDGLSPFEAAATGLPLIVSRTAGCHEILTHMENAILINPKSPKDIADAVLKLCNDENLYKKMSKGASNFLRENLSWEKYANGVIAIMQRAIERKNLLGPVISYPKRS